MSDPPAGDPEFDPAAPLTLGSLVKGMFDAEIRRIDRMYEPPPDLNGAFKLLDPSSFDWGAATGATGSVHDWTTRDREVWEMTMRGVAELADKIALALPELAGPFGAFAVTLRTRAVMGPSGPPTDAGRP